eukprot:4601834-Amphidinium_carterae.1
MLPRSGALCMAGGALPEVEAKWDCCGGAELLPGALPWGTGHLAIKCSVEPHLWHRIVAAPRLRPKGSPLLLMCWMLALSFALAWPAQHPAVSPWRLPVESTPSSLRLMVLPVESLGLQVGVIGLIHQ